MALRNRKIISDYLHELNLKLLFLLFESELKNYKAFIILKYF
jgi:hypothetical protein